MTYTPDQDPSRYLAARLDLVIRNFSFISPTTPQEAKSLQVLGFRVVPNKKCSVSENVKNVLNNFPYFFTTRVLPFLQFYYPMEMEDKVVLVIMFYDLAVEYTIDITAMQLDSPCSAEDLKESLPAIQRMGNILYLGEGATEVCFNQAVNPRSSVTHLLGDKDV